MNYMGWLANQKVSTRRTVIVLSVLIGLILMSAIAAEAHLSGGGKGTFAIEFSNFFIIFILLFVVLPLTYLKLKHKLTKEK